MRSSGMLGPFMGVTLVVALLIPQPAIAQLGVTGFDTDLSGNPIADGQVLLHEFGAVGITLRGSGHPTCGSAFANDDHPGDFGSPPNVISLCPGWSGSSISDLLFGRIRAQFLTPVISVCVEVRPDGAEDYAVMWAYDGSGTLIHNTFSSPGSVERLCVGGQWIREVAFTGFEDHLVKFDDLRVVFGPLDPPAVRFLPGVANLPGYGGTRWRTDLEVTNRGDDVMELRAELLVRDQSNPRPDWRSFPVPPGESVKIDNVLGSLFGFEGAATLRLLGDGGRLVANARTYNDDPSGTYGQFIGTLSEFQAIRPGQKGMMNLLSQSRSGEDGYRTNLGLVNPTVEIATAEIEVYNTEGDLVATGYRTLDRLDSIQIDRVLEVMGGGIEEGYIVVWNSTPGLHLFAYASVIDNRSGDGIYVPAIIVP